MGKHGRASLGLHPTSLSQRACIGPASAKNPTLDTDATTQSSTSPRAGRKTRHA